MDSTLLTALTADGTVRVIAVDGTRIADDTRCMHQLPSHAAILAGEATIAAALLSAHVKDDERILLQVRGEYPDCSLIAEVDAFGAVRAKLTPRDAGLPADHRFTGVFVAAKSDATREVYRGTTEIIDEPIDAALQRHLGWSSQVDAIIRIGATAGPDGITAACGILVERLGADPSRPSIDSAVFTERYSALHEREPDELLAEIRSGRLLGAPLQILDQRPLVWRCRCSAEKVEGMLLGLGRDTLREMLDEDGQAEVTCHFCNQVRVIGRERLAALVARAPFDA